MLIVGDEPLKNVLRFNAKAFRNNYNLSDLTKMNLVFYGVKVGICHIDNLDMSKEFDYAKKSPSAEKIIGDEVASGINELNVYDIVFAGIENE